MSIRDLGWLTSEKLAFALSPSLDQIEKSFKNLFYKDVSMEFGNITEVLKRGKKKRLLPEALLN